MGASALDVVERMIAAERAKGPARGFFPRHLAEDRKLACGLAHALVNAFFGITAPSVAVLSGYSPSNLFAVRGNPLKTHHLPTGRLTPTALSHLQQRAR